MPTEKPSKEMVEMVCKFYELRGVWSHRNVAEFGERVARERSQTIVALLEEEFACDCGEGDTHWKDKKAGKMYNTESGHAIECPKYIIRDVVVRKFCRAAAITEEP